LLNERETVDGRSGRIYRCGNKECNLKETPPDQHAKGCRGVSQQDASGRKRSSGETTRLQQQVLQTLRKVRWALVAQDYHKEYISKVHYRKNSQPNKKKIIKTKKKLINKELVFNPKRREKKR